MALRSVNPYTSYQLQLDLQRTKEKMSTLTEQIASGNRLTKLGDDPTASALVLNFQDSIQQNNGYIKQADTATTFLQTSETAVQAVSDAISQLQVLIIQAGSTASDRLATVPGVTGIRDNLLALANTQSQGKYLFAGTNTTTIPFSLTATGADYAGDSNNIKLDVSASTTVTTNIPGDTVFFNGAKNSNGDLFAQVTNLVNGLNANNTAVIQAASDNLDTIFGNIQSNLAVLGGRQTSLQQISDNTSNYNASLQNIQDSYQAVDYPAASADYSQAQTSQQAALSMLGKMNTLNLFNYLT